MRLWHKDLIHYLPKQQLLGQWRECCSIASNIKSKGSPNHILVNKIMDYPLEHFYIFCYLVYAEMIDRGYKVNWNRLQIVENNLTKPEDYCAMYSLHIFYNWHNDIYLRECLYNLEEKYLCGGITKNEWKLIYDRFNYLTPLQL